MLPLAIETLVANLEIANALAAAISVVWIVASLKNLLYPILFFAIALLINLARLALYFFYAEVNTDLVFAFIQAMLCIVVGIFLLLPQLSKSKPQVLFVGASILWILLILGAFFGDPDPRIAQEIQGQLNLSAGIQTPLQLLGSLGRRMLLIHIVLASIGGCFAILNFISALFYWKQLSNLKQKKFQKILPSLNTLDNLCKYLNNFSLLSISLSLISGFFLIQAGIDMRLVSPAKLVWAFGIWISAMGVLFFRLPLIKSSQLVHNAEKWKYLNPLQLPLWLFATLLGSSLVILTLFGTIFRDAGV